MRPTWPATVEELEQRAAKLLKDQKELRDKKDAPDYADIPWQRVINSQGRISIASPEHTPNRQAELLAHPSIGGREAQHRLGAGRGRRGQRDRAARGEALHQHPPALAGHFHAANQPNKTNTSAGFIPWLMMYSATRALVCSAGQVQ